ncbi:MAG: hypothetical protein HPY44_05945 [Armatimonadetes bacterium]|nr:hypothetical protein [Armatimonadota bacterium]
MDEARTRHILKRTCQITAALAVVAALIVRFDPYAPAMLLVGAALGVAFIGITARTVQRSRPGVASRWRKVRATALYVAKLLIAGLAFWGATQLSEAALPVLAAGYTLPMVVLMLVALAGEIAGSRRTRDTGRG